MFHLAKDTAKEHYWRGRMSFTKKRDIHQLLKHPGYKEGFDNLLCLPGLRPGIKLGTLHRLLTLKCPEEVVLYLRRIYTVWKKLVGNETEYMSLIDAVTVQSLQLRAPALCRSDRAHIDRLFSENIVFTQFTAETRQEIRGRLMGVEDRIPSLATFFEDLKFLEPAAMAMKKLVGTVQVSLRETFIWHHSRPDDRREKERGYRKLWLYAMQWFPELTSYTPRKEKNKSKPEVLELDQLVLCNFAQLAYQLGFDTDEIRSLKKPKDAELSAARAFLMKARPRSEYDYDEAFLLAQSKKILDNLEMFSARVAALGTPELTATTPLDITRRWGRPFETDHMNEKRFLTIGNMEDSDFASVALKPHVSSFFCMRSIYHAFFLDYGFIARKRGRTQEEPDEVRCFPVLLQRSTTNKRCSGRITACRKEKGGPAGPRYIYRIGSATQDARTKAEHGYRSGK